MKILKIIENISFKELDFQKSCNKMSTKEGIFISLRKAQGCSTWWSGGLGGFTPLPEIVKTKKILERSIIKLFPFAVLFALNLVLRHLKVLNFEFPPCRALFYSQCFLNIITDLGVKIYS